MGMTLTVTCSMCMPPRRPDLELNIQEPQDLDPIILKNRIQKEGWIVQFNGDNMDTYCTKNCAE